MKQFIINSIRVLSILSFIIALFMIIAGLGAQHDIGYVLDGIGIIFCCFIAWGFSFIVEAACIYIEKQSEETSEE